MPKVKLREPNLTVSPTTRQYMIDGIRYICGTFKKRLPGSQPERNAQAFFQKELGGYCDNVMMEDFDLHPGAFMGFIPIAALFMLASVVLYWVGHGSVAIAVIGFVLPLLALLMFLFEFLFYRNFVDFLFPKKVSRNVYGVRKPQGEVKRRIIFGGHTDAANEWRWSMAAEAKGLAVAIFGGVASMLLGLFINLARMIYVILAQTQYGEFSKHMRDYFSLADYPGWLAMGVVLLVTIPFIIIIALFINYKIVVDGANDNLSANFISMSVIRDMAEQGFRFENTEVGCLLTGAEEAGIRGAKAFSQKHKKDLSDVETIFISMDTMREIKEMRVCNFGCTGTVKNDKAVGNLLHEAAGNCGIDIPDSELYPGAVDAEAFSMVGLRATGFTAVSHEAKRYYHTRQDTADNIDPECLALSLNICKEAAHLFDAKGMAPYDADQR
ncbi:MAG: M28 family peptidase [Oscillospiraceae bacterium]|jgi:hypothetical protein|nr:M28 family peptidase [Oscillospiraceae bacterium]